MTNKDGSPRQRWQCPCGSGDCKEAMHDGYGIFMTYACSGCWAEKRKGFRSDIFERYEADEPIEEY